MLYREIIAVCSQIHTKHINIAVWGERGIVNVKPAGPPIQHTLSLCDVASHVGNIQKCLARGWTQTKACSSNSVVTFN
jgi:hypothetical protein